ncbi:hypothetical protein K488DRAFT_74182 [Vararia minispora EC-137]|uniref:Uncharacterized protein n=1 Tax=Vararia minispora EC-137 TaxID=1314806 RepID=A0ACB8Q880_9AGAM|nr:hypothetical protein K488DRAFT_74182 [Vararia minispora EC-137]
MATPPLLRQRRGRELILPATAVGHMQRKTDLTHHSQFASPQPHALLWLRAEQREHATTLRLHPKDDEDDEGENDENAPTPLIQRTPMAPRNGNARSSMTMRRRTLHNENGRTTVGLP